MATLTITVTNAQAQRAMQAFGRSTSPNGPDRPSIWQPATAAEIQEAILKFVRARVIEHEARLAQEADLATRTGEVW